MKQVFEFHGHKPILTDGLVQCDTCSIPLVIAEAIKFMAHHSVRSMVVDGAEIKRLY